MTEVFLGKIVSFCTCGNCNREHVDTYVGDGKEPVTIGNATQFSSYGQALEAAEQEARDFIKHLNHAAEVIEGNVAKVAASVEIYVSVEKVFKI